MPHGNSAIRAAASRVEGGGSHAYIGKHRAPARRRAYGLPGHGRTGGLRQHQRHQGRRAGHVHGRRHRGQLHHVHSGADRRRQGKGLRLLRQAEDEGRPAPTHPRLAADAGGTVFPLPTRRRQPAGAAGLGVGARSVRRKITLTQGLAGGIEAIGQPHAGHAQRGQRIGGFPQHILAIILQPQLAAGQHAGRAA
ncbi:conserved hypothetical protein [Ricinus communis]|uniref:Uncharacterized protein n=1 Tax=Ricinus communis TaxID=3988 RepID=B9TES2_RICCO|nr:conserved hypothetical protein [Ricinus communis]